MHWTAKISDKLSAVLISWQWTNKIKPKIACIQNANFQLNNRPKLVRIGLWYFPVKQFQRENGKISISSGCFSSQRKIENYQKLKRENCDIKFININIISYPLMLEYCETTSRSFHGETFRLFCKEMEEKRNLSFVGNEIRFII